MRKICWMVFAAMALSTSTGCLIPIYSGDPLRRAQQLIFTSEDLRTITDEWERIWFLDQPSHMTMYRTHGGIL
jgi:ABC-type dipeptide/oligopeptide/nickel transport system permease component